MISRQQLFALAVSLCSASCLLAAESVPKRRATTLDFPTAISHAMAEAVRLAKLSPMELSMEVHSKEYSDVPLPTNTSAYAKEKEGVYTYVWGDVVGGKGLYIEGVVVEFYSGGLWFQVATQKYHYKKDGGRFENPEFGNHSIYWYNANTREGGELSPKSEKKSMHVPLGEFLDRDFKIES